MNPKVLILEDDLSLAQSLSQEFNEHGYEVHMATQFSEVPQNVIFDFAVIDLRLKGEFGLNIIEQLKDASPECRIVILTGYGSITTAVEAVKLGAVDYLTKPASFEKIEQALLGKKLELGPTPKEGLQAPSLSQIEHEYIDYMLTKNKGNISKTAKDLGLHRQSLQRKLKKYT